MTESSFACAACTTVVVQEPKPVPPPPAASAQPAAPAAAQPQGPQAMSHAAFDDFLHGVDMEAGDAAKLRFMESALSHNWITAAMAGVLIDRVVYRADKLLAVPLLKDRIVDKEHSYWLYEHFTYREDKAKVQEMLEH